MGGRGRKVGPNVQKNNVRERGTVSSSKEFMVFWSAKADAVCIGMKFMKELGEFDGRLCKKVGFEIIEPKEA